MYFGAFLFGVLGFVMGLEYIGMIPATDLFNHPGLAAVINLSIAAALLYTRYKRSAK